VSRQEPGIVGSVTGKVTGIEFDATIIPPPRGLGALVVLPSDTAAIFGTRSRVPVRATFNGIPYRGSAMPLGDGVFGLGITKSIRDAAGVDIGDSVHVVVQRDGEARSVEVPDDLSVALRAAGLQDRFAGLAFSHRREFVRWVTEAKRAETRASRVAKAVAMVAAGKALS
jgi:hypothetical protein